MATANAALESKLSEAALEAGFLPGRRVRVSMEYADTEDTRKAVAPEVQVYVQVKPAMGTTTGPKRSEAMAKLLAMKGIGRTLVGEQRHEDIEARIREFRGDE